MKGRSDAAKAEVVQNLLNSFTMNHHMPARPVNCLPLLFSSPRDAAAPNVPPVVQRGLSEQSIQPITALQMLRVRWLWVATRLAPTRPFSCRPSQIHSLRPGHFYMHQKKQLIRFNWVVLLQISLQYARKDSGAFLPRCKA